MDVKKHIERLNIARDEFRRADIDEKIKRALKSWISSKNNETYEFGDKVYFKDKDSDNWSGPAKVIGLDGRVAYLKYGNMLHQIPSSKLI